MLSQSINTEIIQDLIQLLSKTFALLLIEDHEMIDNFLGIDTDIGGGGWGDDSFFFFKGQVKSPVLHNTRDGSEFYVPYISHYM